MTQNAYLEESLELSIKGEKYRRSINTNGEIRWARWGLLGWTAILNREVQRHLESALYRLQIGEEVNGKFNEINHRSETRVVLHQQPRVRDFSSS